MNKNVHKDKVTYLFYHSNQILGKFSDNKKLYIKGYFTLSIHNCLANISKIDV